MKFNKQQTREKFEVAFSDQDKKSLNSFGSSEKRGYLKQISLTHDPNNQTGVFEYEESD